MSRSPCEVTSSLFLATTLSSDTLALLFPPQGLCTCCALFLAFFHPQVSCISSQSSSQEQYLPCLTHSVPCWIFVRTSHACPLEHWPLLGRDLALLPAEQSYAGWGRASKMSPVLIAQGQGPMSMVGAPHWRGHWVSAVKGEVKWGPPRKEKQFVNSPFFHWSVGWVGWKASREVYIVGWHLVIKGRGPPWSGWFWPFQKPSYPLWTPCSARLEMGLA